MSGRRASPQTASLEALVETGILPGDVFHPGALAAEAKIAGPWQPASLQLAAGTDGEYVALFTASLAPYEADADVFALRSLDKGKSWNAPVAVNAYAAHDGGNDFDPAIATDGSGRWLALFRGERHNDSKPTAQVLENTAEGVRFELTDGFPVSGFQVLEVPPNEPSWSERA